MPLPDWFKSPATLQAAPNDDDSHRRHIAANDPAFPAKREAVIALIGAGISDIATPLGYTRNGDIWAHSTTRGKTVVHLQRSRFGWDAQINLRFLPVDGDFPANSIWAAGEEINLGHFGAGNIAYIDVSTNAASLDLHIQTLRANALPWLHAHHATWPSIADYLPKTT
jgi:hypothetical protein